MKRICVYCGSSPGRLPACRQAAESLAEALVKREIGLIYGGASVGIMGLIADQVLARDGTVIGVIPQVLVDKEVAHPGLSKLIIVESMHERKATMAELADGFIAMPGGLGTLEELFEIWTWGVLGIHRKPCGLLNVAGYYDLLNAFLQHAVDSGFIKKEQHRMVITDDDPDALLTRMQHHRVDIATPGLTPRQT